MMKTASDDRFLLNIKPVPAVLLRCGKLLLLGILIGIPCGFLGALFHRLIDVLTEFRQANGFLIFFLPLGALLTAFFYERSQNRVNVNNVLSSIRTGEKLPFLTVPLIFLSTLLSHTFGASSGKEGAAIQMGGTVGYQLAKLLRLDEKDTRTAVAGGLSAFFAAVFGTPVTAVFFALDVVSIGSMLYAQLIPCLSASVTAFAIASRMGVAPLSFAVLFPKAGLPGILMAMLIGLLCAAVGILFCEMLHRGMEFSSRKICSPYVRAAVLGLLLLLMNLPEGTEIYRGAGIPMIEAAFLGQSRPLDFFLKMLFTAVTIAAGFKGGEVVPTMAVGAALGCLLGKLFGVDAAVSAALGLIGLFCAMVNTPVASVIMGVELFGAEGLLFYVITCTISFALSGASGLYHDQILLYSKLSPDRIDQKIRS